MSVEGRPDRETIQRQLSELSPVRRALLQRRLSRAEADSLRTQGIDRSESTLTPRRATALSSASCRVAELSAEVSADAPLLIAETSVAHSPLSFDQQRIWLEDQLRRGSAYTAHERRLLRGKLDIGALNQSVQHIVARHEVLRTRFVVVDGKPIQVVDKADEWQMSIEDLSGLHADRVSAASRLADREAATTFDLGRDRLFRCLLVKLSDTEHLLSITLHHIVCDAWSFNLFVQELSALYRAGGNLERAKLSSMLIQYRDYAKWQRNWLTGESLDARVDYWRRHLEAAPPALTLPAAGHRSPSQDLAGGRVQSELSLNDSMAISDLCRTHRVTKYMALLAALAALLHRWSGQDHVVLGTSVTTRRDARMHHLIGFFVNTLPLHVDLSGNPVFTDVLKRVREVALDGYGRNGDVPFDLLVNKLRPPRDPTRTPLFQVCLAMAEIIDEGELPGLSIKTIESPAPPSMFELDLLVQDTPETLRFTLLFHRERYDAETMRILLGQFCALLHEVALDPTARILDYRLEKDGAADPSDRAQSRRVERRKHWSPSDVVVTDSAGSWTHGWLSQTADQIAHVLEGGEAAGWGAATVATARTVGFVAAIVGFDRANVPITFVEAGSWSTGDSEGSVALGPDSTTAPCSEVLAARAPGAPGVGATRPEREDGAKPTGSGADWAVSRFALSESDRFAVLSGSSGQIVSAASSVLWVGASLWLPDDETVTDVDALVDWLRTNEISVVYLTPPQLRAMAATVPLPLLPLLPLLRYMFVANAGELMYRDVSDARRISQFCRLISIYRVKDSGLPSAVFAVPDDWREDTAPLRVPLGLPPERDGMQLLNSAGRPVATGEVGEVLVEGRRTGDLARRQHDGMLQFVSPGGCHDPLEVVAALRELPHVRDAVVKERVPSDGGSGLMAYVATDDPATSAVDLRHHLTAQLPAYLVPDQLLLLDRVPLTSDGDYDLTALPDPAFGTSTGETYVPPRTSVERQLASIFEDLLDADQVGVHDTFFELNGFSLLATRLVSRIRGTFNVGISLRDVFTAPTVEGLAQIIVQAQAKLAGPDQLEALLNELE